MKTAAVLAVYPGTFDPPHMGHIDIVDRALQIFPGLVVGVLYNPAKKTLFEPSERVEMLSELYRDRPGVEVRMFSGLLVKFLQELDARVVIRGMRAVSDFEYEFQMALMNRRLHPEAETVFLTPKEEYTYLSSRLVKEVVALGGDVSGLVPEPVMARLTERFLEKTGAEPG